LEEEDEEVIWLSLCLFEPLPLPELRSSTVPARVTTPLVTFTIISVTSMSPCLGELVLDLLLDPFIGAAITFGTASGVPALLSVTVLTSDSHRTGFHQIGHASLLERGWQ
jgi:hypothetical protein